MNRHLFASLVGIACAACGEGSTTPPQQGPFYAPTYEPPAHGKTKSSAGTDVVTDAEPTVPARPEKLTLRGSVTDIHVKHTRLGDEVKSSLSFTADVTATPAIGKDDALDFYAAGIEMTLATPDAGTCEPELVFELDGGTLTGTFTGVDALGTLDCSTWLDAVSEDGFTIKLAEVPWLDAEDERAAVKLAVTREN